MRTCLNHETKINDITPQVYRTLENLKNIGGRSKLFWNIRQYSRSWGTAFETSRTIEIEIMKAMVIEFRSSQITVVKNFDVRAPECSRIFSNLSRIF